MAAAYARTRSVATVLAGLAALFGVAGCTYITPPQTLAESVAADPMLRGRLGDGPRLRRLTDEDFIGRPMDSAILRQVRTAMSGGERECLAQAVYYEARGEAEAGQAAIAAVVMNRVRSPRYPKSVCEVVFQGAPRRGCQFSFACNGAMLASPPHGPAWRKARKVADAVIAGEAGHEVGNALSFHADYVSPSWAAVLPRITQIGGHTFYGGARKMKVVQTMPQATETAPIE
ncbi:cell wall hydrolase [Caulobacter segnis]|uniref:cell wall hydrolase n=1 Tax=Caulobacter segnis TaxID=88688 RepID=UPI0024107AD9|nr:cell wall hydrolase [Caulobacter segnis]MDG2521965.1 cell wall hydrolase [Caulobacter segnis]